jgi:hypothetical protein
MSVVDDVLRELPAWRQQAEALMVDTGTAQRPNGTHYDPAAQADVVDYDPDFGFTSRCKINARNVAALDQEVGSRTATTVRLELHLPIDTPPLAAGDVWTLTVVSPISSTTVGTAYRVTAPVDGTLRTASRYEIERVVS